MLLRSLQQSLPTLLHRSGAAFTTSTSLRGLEELIVLPPKEDAKPPSTGARPARVGVGRGEWGQPLAARVFLPPFCRPLLQLLLQLPDAVWAPAVSHCCCRARLGGGRPAA
jgi:hypothetical protein